MCFKISFNCPSLHKVGRTVWPDKFGSGAAAHGVVVDLLAEVRQDMTSFMNRRKLSKQVT